MQIVHFGHSCVLAETSSARLLIDPGSFSSGFEELSGLDAILITHAHPDHLDIDRLPALLAANPGAELVVDAGSAKELGDVAHRVVRPGEQLEIAGASVEVIGGDHAVIHPDIPMIPNNGYLVDGSVLHPGDAFTPPGRQLDALLLPTGAPWLKLSEAVDYLRAVAPGVAVPIHQAVLAMPEMYYDHFRNLAPRETELVVAAHGEPLTV
ncbi:MAG TPA: MBL fold metallo-hydrolase [Pseudonocardiaceae bacterium]|nr:MBL fold metallo-hydrolase [Pseudonocardiaceae bacterium]